ncbi:MAG: helix-turn-helix transcriptional regulator [Cytophagales bacterium]
MESIGTKIKHVRELKKISVKEMADLLQMSVQGYSKIERDETDVPYSRLTQIAGALGEKLENLVNFDPKYYFNQVNTNTITGHIYNTITDNERRLYEEQIALLKDKIAYLEKK